MFIRLFAAIISVGLMVLGAAGVAAQNYPNKPIRIVTSASGGTGDFTTRLIRQGLSDSLGQPVVVDNRDAQILGAQIVSQAAPDGYTLLVTGGLFWNGPFLQKTPYDPVKDFAPITLLARLPILLVVNPSVPAKSVKELIAFAKAKPGVLNYASSTDGGLPHLGAELFKAMAGVDIVRIPFKSVGPAITSLVGDEVQVMFTTVATVAPYVKSGRLRALASTGARPTALFPDLPTVAESLPGFESETLQGMWGPAKTPKVIIKRLNEEIVRLLNEPDLKQKFFSTAAEAAPSSPEEFASIIKSDMARNGKLIKDLGIVAK